MRIALRTPSARAIATSSGWATVRKVVIRLYNSGERACISLSAGGLQCFGRRFLAIDSTEHSKNRQLLLQAFESELAESLGGEAAHHAIKRVLRDHDLPRFRDATLEPRRDVHRAAKDGVVDALLGADVADNRRTAVDADTNLHFWQSDFLAFVVPFADQALQHDAGEDGAIGVIFLRD